MQEQLEALQVTHAAAMEAKNAAEDAATVKGELESDRKIVAEAQKQAAATHSAWAATVSQFEATVVCDVGQLPEYRPEGEGVDHCSNLFWLLQSWSLAGGSIPFCLGDLRNEAGAKAGVDSLITSILGPLAKSLMPPTPTGKTVISRQTALTLLHALERVKSHFDGMEDQKQAAAASYAVILDTSKKRRAMEQ